MEHGNLKSLKLFPDFSVSMLWAFDVITLNMFKSSQIAIFTSKIRWRMLILECSQECYGRTEGRTDGSVTISLRNFVGEGIIRKIYIPIFDCIASIIDECYSRNSLKLLNHLNPDFSVSMLWAFDVITLNMFKSSQIAIFTSSVWKYFRAWLNEFVKGLSEECW
jgi:hypothetical protein